MKAGFACLAIGVLLAGAPQAAAKPAAAKTAHGATGHKATPRKPDHAAVPAALAAMPLTERLAIEADLAWLGYFNGLSAEEFDAHTADAIKAFQQHNGGKPTGTLTAPERVLLATVAKPRQATVGWRLIDDASTGTRLGVPEQLAAHTTATRTGSRWRSAQGQIQIETFRLREASLPALYEDERKRAHRHVASGQIDADSFIIIGEQDLKKFVVRAQARGGDVRGVSVLYDQATEGMMAPIAVAIAGGFVGFPDADAAPPPGMRRGVDYGTAIVVTPRGDLLAARDVTADCQSITVPGFGHADRTATERDGGLALLRLYGAHDLIPAPLGRGSDSPGADLTLFGIGGPPADHGRAPDAGIKARLTSDDLVPMPPFGFSGAAAVDGQKRFAGVVALKSVVADSGAAMPAATLIGAGAVRAFLAAQHITPAETGDMSRSVLRLICVRR